ncbi:MAG: ribonuclease Y [Bacilli bacterium]
MEWLYYLLFLLVGLGIGIGLFFLIPAFKAKQAFAKAQKTIKEAEIKAEHIVKSAELDAKQFVYEGKQELERAGKERRAQISELERLLTDREKGIERRDQLLLSKEQSLDARHENLNGKIKEADELKKQLQVRIDSIISELEKVAQMTVSEARTELFSRVDAKLEKEIALYIKQREDEADIQVNDRARDILANTIARYSQEVTTERTVSAVSLPSDEMKGRIIGREGRNIRSLEQLLGVDILIDDTPEVITVSCFDPIRRETARRTIEILVKDGRIQPSRIEEVVAKAKEELDEVILKAGKDALAELGIPNVHREMIPFVGRLKYRTSYGQSALKHSIEVAHLCGIMAAELGLDVTKAKRAGLFHDIGKSADFELEGSHVEVGARLAKKYNEPDYVIDGIESHHGDKESRFIFSQLVIAADTLSAARPGARTETLENYIKRLEQLEAICKSYDGVQTSYAMQSGREVRVMVYPDKVDDVMVNKLVRDIRERIENEMTYPGQIKVSVIREYRANDVAK